MDEWIVDLMDWMDMQEWLYGDQRVQSPAFSLGFAAAYVVLGLYVLIGSVIDHLRGWR